VTDDLWARRSPGSGRERRAAVRSTMDEFQIDEFSKVQIGGSILGLHHHAVFLAGPEKQLKHDLSQRIAEVLGIEFLHFDCPDCTPFQDNLPLSSLLENESYPFLYIDRVELAGFDSLRWLRNVLEQQQIRYSPAPKLLDCIFVLSTEEYSDILASPEAVNRILFDQVLPNRPFMPKERWPTTAGARERADVFRHLWWERMERRSTVIDIAGVTLLGRANDAEAGDPPRPGGAS
jgi:hypothetical protein